VDVTGIEPVTPGLHRGPFSDKILHMPLMINPIDSAKQKLVRAGKHLKEIKRRIAKYPAGEPHEIIVESERKATMKITFPPHDIAIPTAATVKRIMLMIFPPFLPICSTVFASINFSETIVWPGHL